MQILLIIIILIIWYVCFNKNKEGYDSITYGRGAQPNTGIVDPYYLWRAYNHDPYNYEALCNYPYNYKPHPYPERINTYKPNFYQYGYGHY